MRTFVRRGVLTAALIAGASTGLFASDFVVTKTADTSDGACDADCSLREAIIAANAHPGADRIVLGAGLTYTLTRGPADAAGAIVPGTGDLDVIDALTIDGNGSTIDAAGLDRAFDIEGTFIVTMNNLAIKNGAASGFLSLGGGIYIKSAAVTLNNCTVVQSSTVLESGARDAGGGIAAVGSFNAATGATTPAVLTLSNTTVSGNTGSNGGGVVCVLCQLLVSNTTFTGNTSSSGDGAGVTVYGNASTATINGGTFTGNTGAARGGAFAMPVGTGTIGITRARILSNGASTASGIFDNAASVTATNNWWGCNFGPGAGGAGCTTAADAVSAGVTAAPYLVLQGTLSAPAVNPTVSDTFTADLTGNSAGANVAPGGTVPDGIAVAFSSTLGTLTQTSGLTSAGKASSLFTAGLAAGSAALSATVDNQTVTTSLPVVLPQVSVDHAALQFAAATVATAFAAATSPQAVHLTQSGAGPVTWNAVSNQPWLVVSPVSGTGSATLQVSVQFVPGLASLETGSITLTFTGTGNSAGPIGVTLNTIAAPAAPFGSFDTPADGSTGLAGSIAVTGWALDDVQVSNVAICRDAISPETVVLDARCGSQPKIYIGDAVFIDGARPDVQAFYSTYPVSSRAGWGYLMLTNFLPNLGDGTYNLYAYAHDTDGHSTLLGSKTITCANSASTTPFGAIDTPAQGETIHGAAYANFGWVLSPAPSFADPPDGGTVSVFIDGTNVGSPAGWAARPDLTAVFPAAQFPGISRALGLYGVDTTAFANGLHTIAWIVTNNAGTTAGVGSRFITISNGSLLAAPSVSSRASAGASSADVESLPVDETPIAGRRGFDTSAPLREYGATAGTIVVQAEELDRIELHFKAGKGRRSDGYMRTPSGLAALPAGSQIDSATGVFSWQAGAGFIGAYDLVFVESTGGVPAARVNVRIVLHPKRSDRVGPQTIVDAPAEHAPDGTPVVVSAGGFVVTGWAADFSSTFDNGVEVVHVWAYRIDGGASNPVFIGPAIVDGSRPDVAAIYGERFGRSGYGVTVTGLAPGTYDIAVFPFSTVVRDFTPPRVVRVRIR